MADVSIRELRNRGGDVVDRARRGEPIVITRDGEPVAELRPMARRRITSVALIAQMRGLPTVNADLLRADLDASMDSTL